MKNLKLIIKGQSINYKKKKNKFSILIPMINALKGSHINKDNRGVQKNMNIKELKKQF